MPCACPRGAQQVGRMIGHHQRDRPRSGAPCPRSRPSGARAQQVWAAIRPTARRSRRSSSICRSGRAGRRHLVRLRVAVARRAALEHVGDEDVAGAVRPIAFSIASSSWPAAPTKGSPRRSSSAPGASPTTSQSARCGPTPNTPWVRVRCSGHRVQRSTSSRSACHSGASPAAGASCGTGSAPGQPAAGTAPPAPAAPALQRHARTCRGGAAHPLVDAEGFEVLLALCREHHAGVPGPGAPRIRRRSGGRSTTREPRVRRCRTSRAACAAGRRR